MVRLVKPHDLGEGRLVDIDDPIVINIKKEDCKNATLWGPQSSWTRETASMRCTRIVRPVR